MRQHIKNTVFSAIPAVRKFVTSPLPVSSASRRFTTFSRQNIQNIQNIQNVQTFKAGVGMSAVLAGCVYMYTKQNNQAQCQAQSSPSATRAAPAAPAAPAASITTISTTTTTPDATLSPSATTVENPLDENDYRYLGYTGRIGRILAFTANKIRFLGYSSDIGESMRPLMDPRWVKLFYGVTWTYVFGDVGWNMYNEAEKGSDNMIIARTGIKVFTFQSIASVALPTLIIHTAVHQSQKLFVNAPGRLKILGPVLVGLAIIPALPYLDEPAEEIIHSAFDKYWPVEGAGHED